MTLEIQGRSVDVSTRDAHELTPMTDPMTDRRTFIVSSLAAVAAAPFASVAQQTRARPVVGYLSPFSPGATKQWLNALRDGLHAQGYDDGVNVAIEARFADDHYEQLSALASELIGLNVDVLFAITTPAAVAAKRATTGVPIVFTLVSDPVRIGLVTNLAHPGGNVTGATDITSDLLSKRLALLKEAVPRLRRVGVLGNPDNPTTALAVSDLESAARNIGLGLYAVNVRRPGDLDAGFASLESAGVGALMIVADATVTEMMPAIVRRATARRLPLIGWNRSWTEHGAPFSYGTEALVLQHQAAAKVAKILKGTKPGVFPWSSRPSSSSSSISRPREPSGSPFPKRY